MGDDPKQLYRRWLLQLWHGELDVAEQLIAEDFLDHWPDRDVRGRSALVQLIGETREVFSELTIQLELGPIAEGDLVAARWTGIGRSADGDMRLFGSDLLRLQDGRFAEYWVASWAGS